MPKPCFSQITFLAPNYMIGQFAVAGYGKGADGLGFE